MGGPYPKINTGPFRSSGDFNGLGGCGVQRGRIELQRISQGWRRIGPSRKRPGLKGRDRALNRQYVFSRPEPEQTVLVRLSVAVGGDLFGMSGAARLHPASVQRVAVLVQDSSRDYSARDQMDVYRVGVSEGLTMIIFPNG